MKPQMKMPACLLLLLGMSFAVLADYEYQPLTYTALSQDTYRVAVGEGDVACGAISSSDYQYNAKMVEIKTSGTSLLGGPNDVLPGDYYFEKVLFDPIGIVGSSTVPNGTQNMSAEPWHPKLFYKLPFADCWNWVTVAYDSESTANSLGLEIAGNDSGAKGGIFFTTDDLAGTPFQGNIVLKEDTGNGFAYVAVPFLMKTEYSTPRFRTSDTMPQRAFYKISGTGSYLEYSLDYFLITERGSRVYSAGTSDATFKVAKRIEDLAFEQVPAIVSPTQIDSNAVSGLTFSLTNNQGRPHQIRTIELLAPDGFNWSQTLSTYLDSGEGMEASFDYPAPNLEGCVEQSWTVRMKDAAGVPFDSTVPLTVCGRTQISLVSPSNSVSSESMGSFTFRHSTNYKAPGEFPETFDRMCRLTVNEVNYAWDRVPSGSDYTFVQGPFTSAGTYNWHVECGLDAPRVASETRTFTVPAPQQSSSSSGGSSSSSNNGGGSVYVPPAAPAPLNEQTKTQMPVQNEPPEEPVAVFEPSNEQTQETPSVQQLAPKKEQEIKPLQVPQTAQEEPEGSEGPVAASLWGNIVSIGVLGLMLGGIVIVGAVAAFLLLRKKGESPKG